MRLVVDLVKVVDREPAPEAELTRPSPIDRALTKW